jgi:hypothetical protein
MIVACVALFVALGGTATAVTYVVSSNSQVAPGTISGHQPPSGKHANLINQSVNATDLAPGAVTTAKLGPGAVTSSRLADGAVTAPKLGADSVNSGNIVNGSVGRADLAGETPNSPTLQNCVGSTPWTAAGTGLDPHYWMDAEGIVHLDGAVSCSGTATGGPIFEMPAKYRPQQNVVRYGVLGGGLSLAQVAVVINPFDAGVVFDGGTNGTTTDNYVSLDGITYRGSP